MLHAVDEEEDEEEYEDDEVDAVRVTPNSKLPAIQQIQYKWCQ